LFKVRTQGFVRCLPGQSCPQKFCWHQSQTLECAFALNPCGATTKLKIMECGIWQQQWKVVKSITVLRYCKSEHPVTQHNFSGRHQSSHNPPLYSTSYWTLAVMNPVRRGENNHHVQMAP
jgi:hypothetical protein